MSNASSGPQREGSTADPVVPDWNAPFASPEYLAACARDVRWPEPETAEHVERILRRRARNERFKADVARWTALSLLYRRPVLVDTEARR